LLAVLLNNELLLGDLLVERVDARPRRQDIGARLIECGLIEARVDPGQELAGVNPLVVTNRHRDDIARYLGSDQRRMRIYICVVGRHQETAGVPPVVAIEAGEDQR
jgi:hypothetical protein